MRLVCLVVEVLRGGFARVEARAMAIIIAHALHVAYVSHGGVRQGVALLRRIERHSDMSSASCILRCSRSLQAARALSLPQHRMLLQQHHQQQQPYLHRTLTYAALVAAYYARVRAMRAAHFSAKKDKEFV
jgi:hypothetical protein